MVVEEEYSGQESYRCEECGFHYKEKRMAEKCEAKRLEVASLSIVSGGKMRKHCRDYDACDTEIAENSLERSV